MPLSRAALRRVLEAPDYRSFVRAWVEERQRNESDFNFSAIARIAGFTSRSFPRDVMTGAKRITLRSRDKFAHGLGLPAELTEYFQILVAIGEVDCRLPGWDERRLEKMASTLRDRLKKRRGESSAELPSQDDRIFHEQFPKIYAALGSEERGATLPEIARRTQLTRAQIQPSLVRLAELGFLNSTGSGIHARYFPLSHQITVEALRKSFPFRRQYMSTAARVLRSAEQGMDSEEKLFLASTFSVNQHDLPRLKSELRNLLQHYIVDAENAEGDRIVELLVGFI